jgi:cytochrome P450
MEQNFATFSKGSRVCIGMQLATAEICMTIAVVIRRFKLKEKNFDRLEHSDFFEMVVDNPVTVVFSSTGD